MSRIVKLGLIQMKSVADKSENLLKSVANIEDAAKKGAQIICLPELFLTPYFCQEKTKKNFELAEEIPGPTTQALGKIAKKHGIVIIASLFEKTKSKKYFNSACVIGPNGSVIGTYHKMHIPSLPPDLYAEDYYFGKGDLGFLVFDTPFAKIAPLVCYDQWFPEGARIAAVKGAEILFYPTAIGWPLRDREKLSKAEHEAWQVVQRSHSIANSVFVAAVNRIGIEGQLKFWGTSFVSDPYGRVLGKAGTEKEKNLIVECNLDTIEEMKKEWKFLEERRIKCEKIAI